MNMVRVHPKVPPEQRTKACRVEGCAGTQHPRTGDAKPGREVSGQMRHDVHRIRDDQQHRLGRVLQHGWNNLAEDVGVALQQLQPGFARPLRHAAGNDHHPGARQIRIIAGADGERVSKRDGVIDVVGFRFRAGAVQVDQHDFPSHAAHDECVG